MFNANDLQIVKSPGTRLLFYSELRNSSGATATTKPGEPVKTGINTSDRFVILLANGDPSFTGSSSDRFVGIAAVESTESATVTGRCSVTTLRSGSMIEGRPTTSANMDTASELDALIGGSVAFDLASGAFTIDEDEVSDPGSLGLIIVGGDLLNLTMLVMVNSRASIFGQ